MERRRFVRVEVTVIIVLVNVIVVLAGVALAFYGGRVASTFWTGVGTSIVASGIVAVFYLVYRYFEQRDERLTSLYDEFRLWGAYPKRDLNDRYRRLLREAKDSVDVLGMGLMHFWQDNQLIMKDKALSGVRFRLLVMDPQSPFIETRQQEEGNSGSIRDNVNKLEEGVQEINQIIEAASREGDPRPQKVELRGYMAMPTNSVFRIDDTMFFGPFFHQKISRSTLTFEAQRGGKAFEEYLQHFERLWDDREFTKSLAVASSPTEEGSPAM